MMNRRLMIFDDVGYCMVIGMESWGVVGEVGCVGLNSGGMRFIIIDFKIVCGGWVLCVFLYFEFFD